MKKILLLFMLMGSLIYCQEWKSVEMRDEFGDKTGEVAIVINTEDGHFSNSATSNSKLEGFIRVGNFEGKKYFSFSNYEYGYGSAVSDMENITIKMKNSKGEIFRTKQYTMTIFNSKKIIDFVKRSNGIIKVVISDKYSTIHKFSFNSNGFTKKLLLVK